MFDSALSLCNCCFVASVVLAISIASSSDSVSSLWISFDCTCCIIYIYIYNRLPVLQISMVRSSSQDLVAASGQRRPQSKQPHASLTMWCVHRHTWLTLEHPTVSRCRQHARCHIACDSVSPTACGGDLPQEVSQV